MKDKLGFGVQLKTFVDINENQYCVSTVNLGSNLVPYAGFETMVFNACDYEIHEYSEFDEFTERYKTEQQAIIGHLNIIEKLIYKLREEVKWNTNMEI